MSSSGKEPTSKTTSGKGSKIDDLLSKSRLGQAGQRPASLMYRTGANARALVGAFSVAIESLLTNPNQVRKTYNEDSLQELAEDIKVRGIIEPLIVRPLKDSNGNYEIIAGERRYRAAKKAGLAEVPVIIRELDDREMRFVMLVENIQREELAPTDEKLFFEQLQGEYNLSVAEIAKLINKSSAYVSRRLNSAIQALQTEVISTDSEKSNNTYAPYESLENSQSNRANEKKPEGKSGKKTSQPKGKFSVSGLQKFTTSLDSAKELFSQPDTRPNEKTTTQIKETLADLKKKIAELEAAIGE